MNDDCEAALRREVEMAQRDERRRRIRTRQERLGNPDE